MLVDPTKSQNMMVRCRRSPVASASDLKEGAIVGDAGVDIALGALSSSAIARSSFRRWPSRTPMSLRSCSVRSGRTLKSMPFSTKRCLYSDKPRLRNQLESLSVQHPQRRPATSDRRIISRRPSESRWTESAVEPIEHNMRANHGCKWLNLVGFGLAKFCGNQIERLLWSQHLLNFGVLPGPFVPR